jgi:ribosomal protein S6--L-glutamate ligase
MMVNQDSAENACFLDAGKRQDVEVTICPFDEILIVLHSSEPPGVVVRDRPLDQFDLVYFKTGVGTLETQHIISEQCRLLGIPVFDKVFEHQQPFTEGKAFSAFKMLQAKLPLVNSLYLAKSKLTETCWNLPFPQVVKPSNRSQGKGVFFYKTPEELKRDVHTFEDRVLIQPYIENSGDVRIFVIGEEAVAAIKRVNRSGDFRHNMAQGAEASVHSLSQEEIDISLKAVEVLNYSIAGVDLVFDRVDEMWKIIEVNRAPLFKGLMDTTGVDIPGKIISFFKDQIKG